MAFAEVLKSPDNNIELEFILGKESAPYYSIKYKGEQIIFPSPLGLNFSEGGLLSKYVDLMNVSKISGKDNYKIVAGKSSEVSVEYNEITFFLQEKVNLKRKLNIIFRTYNEGVAIRYFIPAQEEIKNYEILKEHTIFDFKEDHESWPMILPTFTTSYEEFYNKYYLNNLNSDFLIGLPLTVRLKSGVHVSITEAALNDYAGMYLRKLKDQNNIFKSVLSPLPDHSGIAVKAKPDHKSPWRVIMIGESAGRLVESNLIYHLNEPSVVQDPGWIKPGKCAWNWWADNMVKNASFKPGMNTATMKYYIDFASEYKLEYMLIDAGWYGAHDDTIADITKPIAAINMSEIISYAKSKNVDVLLWINWKSTRDQMDKAFPVFQQWGVKGIKMDYMDRDDQWMVNFYLKVIRKALENMLLVNMHGAHKPSGLSRTYPNLMTYEAVRGMEYNKWARTTPTHHVTIPYTRMLAGSMDVTPGAFRNVKDDKFHSQGTEAMVIGTRCSQLAMFVVYESPLQSLCDYPDAYRGQKGADLFKGLPATWDETRVLKGEVGEYIVIARRKNDEWYIAGMTNEKARRVNFALDFIDAGQYKAVIYQDGPAAKETPTDIEIINKRISTNGEMIMDMAEAGGFMVRIKVEK
ncbi:MAG TPA: glycoside hydrolase family 97 protein [Cytophagaceae bacterium]|nr:glycoside hydrolase family 97 protein [Cytophagaceae bacterium]